jgi:hypothetical protein
MTEEGFDIQENISEVDNVYVSGTDLPAVFCVKLSFGPWTWQLRGFSGRVKVTRT